MLSLVLCGNQPYDWDLNSPTAQAVAAAIATSRKEGMKGFVETFELAVDDSAAGDSHTPPSPGLKIAVELVDVGAAAVLEVARPQNTREIPSSSIRSSAASSAGRLPWMSVMTAAVNERQPVW